MFSFTSIIVPTVLHKLVPVQYYTRRCLFLSVASGTGTHMRTIWSKTSLVPPKDGNISWDDGSRKRLWRARQIFTARGRDEHHIFNANASDARIVETWLH